MSEDGKTEPHREAVFTAVVPLSPDEPTATNFDNPLFGQRSVESSDPPLPSATSSPALSDSFDAEHDATLPMAAWRPPAAVAEAQLDGTPSQAAGFSDPEPTMPAVAYRPGSTSDTDSSLPEVSAMVSGEQLPQPIDLPPVPPPESSRAEPTAEHTLPETKLMGALIDTHSSTAEGALLEGSLEERPGAPVLMTLLAQEITGVLHVHDGDARGRLYCLHGEPVYAEHADGDAGLLSHLQAQGIVPPTFRAVYDDGRAIPDGQLLAVLSNRGMLTGEAVHEFLRSFVRARVLALVNQTSGTYVFYEETGFVDTKPLLKVNPFGLILDVQRRSVPPDDLMRRSGELEWTYVHPRPALAPVAEKLRPFVRGTNLTEHISGRKRVKQLLGLLGLDDLMGTLLVMALERAGLVKLSDNPMESFDDVELADSTIVQEGRIMLPDSEMDGPISADETKAREEIFSLYVRLKPLVMPRDVLGVPLDADVGTINAAYQDKMTALDPKRIPEGSARQLMVSRVEELRRKVTTAYEALTHPPGGPPRGSGL